MRKCPNNLSSKVRLIFPASVQLSRGFVPRPLYSVCIRKRESFRLESSTALLLLPLTSLSSSVQTFYRTTQPHTPVLQNVN